MPAAGLTALVATKKNKAAHRTESGLRLIEEDREKVFFSIVFFNPSGTRLFAAR